MRLEQKLCDWNLSIAMNCILVDSYVLIELTYVDIVLKSCACMPVILGILLKFLNHSNNLGFCWGIGSLFSKVEL